MSVVGVKSGVTLSPGVHVLTSWPNATDDQRLNTAGLRIYTVQLSGISSKEALLHALSQALSFPAYFGNSWDALEECLRDMPHPDGRGFLIFFQNADSLLGLPQPDFTTFLSILAGTTRFWIAQSVILGAILVGGEELAERMAAETSFPKE